MIISEIVTIDCVNYRHTYSDAGVKIRCGNAIYSDAYDTVNTVRDYAETDIPLPDDDD